MIRPLDPAVGVVRVTYRPRVELQDAPKIVVSSLSITHQAIGKREPQPGREAGPGGRVSFRYFCRTNGMPV